MSGRVSIIGSRGSELALWQARHVQMLLQTRFLKDEFRIEIVRTSGDRIQDRALYKVEDRGFFTKEIEEALRNGRIDFAVHSLKDLPTVVSPDLTIAAIPEREDPHDVWLSRDGTGPEQADRGTRVGTSSLRRQAQLRALRPGLSFVELRGNVPTRVRKLESGEFDALVLARAGLSRLGLLPPSAFEIPYRWVLPAPGQGALAVQVRANDEDSRQRAFSLEDRPTRLAVTAERSLLNRLEGGCLAPVGAHAEGVPAETGTAGSGGASGEGVLLRLEAVVADLSGDPLLRHSCIKTVQTEDDAVALGTGLAAELLDRGAAEILERIRAFLRKSAAGSSDSVPGAEKERRA